MIKTDPAMIIRSVAWPGQRTVSILPAAMICAEMIPSHATAIRIEAISRIVFLVLSLEDLRQGIHRVASHPLGEPDGEHEKPDRSHEHPPCAHKPLRVPETSDSDRTRSPMIVARSEPQLRGSPHYGRQQNSSMRS